jgi:N-formylglutamate amidohydrolase
MGMILAKRAWIATMIRARRSDGTRSTLRGSQPRAVLDANREGNPLVSLHESRTFRVTTVQRGEFHILALDATRSFE